MNAEIEKIAFAAAEGTNWKPGLGNEHVAAYMQNFARLLLEDVALQITLAEKVKDDVVLWQNKDGIHITWLLRQRYGIE
jgi:hypothetical protein